MRKAAGAGRILELAAVLALLAPAASGAAVAHPGKDVEWAAEHLPESAMDERYLTLPLMADPLEPGRFQWTLQLAASRTSAKLIDLDGELAAAGVGYALSGRWGIEGLAFEDRMRFGGGGGRDLLHPLFRRDIPLDLPELADFSAAQGDLRHRGAGAALLFQPERSASAGWVVPRSLTAGALWEEVELDGFRLGYTVATGASAGAAGVLDHTATYRYATPFLAARWERPLGSRFALSPWMVAAWPLPRRGLAGRLTGPGFDLAGDTEAAGRGTHMGDPYFGVGLELRHRPSGLAVDLGATVYDALAEGVIHSGVDRPLLLSVSWHPRGR